MKAFIVSIPAFPLRLAFTSLVCLVSVSPGLLVSSASAQEIVGADAPEQFVSDFSAVSNFSELADDPQLNAELKRCDEMRDLQLAYPYIQFVADMLGKQPPLYNPLTTEVIVESLPASATQIACIQELVPQLNRKVVSGKVIYSVSFGDESKAAFLKCLEKGKLSTSSDFANLADAESTIPDLDPSKASDPLYKLLLAYNAQNAILKEHSQCVARATQRSLDRQDMKNE